MNKRKRDEAGLENEGVTQRLTVIEYFDRRLKSSRSGDPIEVDFIKLIRKVCISLISMFKEEKCHGGLPYQIYISDGEIVKALPSSPGAFKINMIKKDLSGLHSLITEMFGLLSRIHIKRKWVIEKYFLQAIDVLLVNDTRHLEDFMEKVIWLLDSPLFYSPLENLNLFDKLYHVVYRAKLVSTRETQLEKLDIGRYMVLRHWSYRARSFRPFAAVLNFAPHRNWDEPLEMIAFFRNILEHYLFRHGLEGKTHAFHTFQSVVCSVSTNVMGSATHELRQLLWDKVKLLANSNFATTNEWKMLVEAIYRYFESTIYSGDDGEIGELLYVWEKKKKKKKSVAKRILTREKWRARGREARR